ncbi:aminopeptidase PaaP [Nocardioides aestuarii]|uniref:M28 family peptidase n=1 Tax=Nocardioides aestuarii TaxID=252231 RepID=A0ABW4TLB4_9ACTN
MDTTARRRAFAVGVITTALVGPTLVVTSPAHADPISETRAIRKAVTLTGVREHQQAFQQIANANGGTRASGTPGYDASADYVEDKLTAAGYTVTRQPFDFAYYQLLATPEFQQISPSAVTYAEGIDFADMAYSGSGNVTAAVQGVDLLLPPGPTANTSTSGCEAGDFAGFIPGNIALMQRGSCAFGLKAANAEAAGAVGVIIFNEGQPGRTDTLFGTLGAPAGIPAIGTSFALGQELANTPGLTVRIEVEAISEIRSTVNLSAQTSGDANNVVVVGAHLDSVAGGPGINDNGSGSAAILEIAEQFKRLNISPRNQVRFMWFGAEENNLIGSSFYVSSLSEAELGRIRANLNFDMIGSPNFVRFVYDGDNSAFPVSGGATDGPQGSGEIERIFRDYFVSQNLPSSETPFNGRSDYGPFIAQGIPAGGLFTGAEGVKTAAEAAVYGGTAGVAYDPCYHQACDTFANNSNTALDQMSDAAAQATLLLAKRNLTRKPLVDPAQPVSATAGASVGGGGLHPDHGEEVAR